MSNELAPTKVNDAELIGHLENLGLLKDLSNGEKNTFIQIAKAFNLNPFKREIYVSKYGGQPASIITGYEVYIKRAERSGQLDGWGVTTEGEVNFENLQQSTLKAIITINRKDRSVPFKWEVEFTEYMQLKDGRLNKFWQKSKTMIKKVAMAQGFRLCFSDELGGMPYTGDEVGVNTEDVQAVVTTAPVTNAVQKKSPNAAQYKKLVERLQKGELQIVTDASINFSLSDEQITELAGHALAYSLPMIKDNPAIIDVLRGYTLNDGATSPYTEAQQAEITNAGMPF